MKFKELRQRLKKLGVDVTDRTLISWREAGFITGPTLEEKPPRRPGRKKADYVKKPGPNYKWPSETLKEAAAVWALKNSDIYLRRPDPETILRAKHKATELHKRYTVTLDLESLPGDEYRTDVTPNGETRTFLHSYDLQSLIVVWITAVEKVRHNVPIREDRKVTFDWARETVQGEANLMFRGVRLEESDSNDLDLFLYRAESKSGQEFEREYYPSSTDSNDSADLS